MATQAGCDREHGGDDRAARAGQVAATVDPRRLQPQRLLDRGDTALGDADLVAHRRVGAEPVDVLGGQAGIGDRLETGIDRERDRVDHQAPAHRRTPDAGEDDLVLEAVGAHRRARRGPLRLRHPLDRVGGARRGEHREPDVVDVLEADLDLHADVQRIDVALDEIGREPDRRVFRQGDVGDDVRRRERGVPHLMVDGEPDDRRPPGQLLGGVGPAAAGRADRRRRADELATVVTPLDPQLPVGAGGPEPRVERGQGGQRSAHGILRYGIERFDGTGCQAGTSPWRVMRCRRRRCPW